MVKHSKERQRIFDFIEQNNGRLVAYNEDGSIKRSGRRIVVRGANDDPRRDCLQTIEQESKTMLFPHSKLIHPVDKHFSYLTL